MKFKVTAEEPGLSEVRHPISEHDSASEAREALIRYTAEAMDSGEPVIPTYHIEVER